MATKGVYKDLNRLPTNKWTMDNPGIVLAVDGILALVKARTDKGLTSFLSELSTLTGLSKNQCRVLLRLARSSGRVQVIYTGHACLPDTANGHRVLDVPDNRTRNRVSGVIAAAATNLQNEVAPLAQMTGATDTDRLIGEMAETRGRELTIMRQILQKQEV